MSSASRPVDRHAIATSPDPLRQLLLSSFRWARRLAVKDRSGLLNAADLEGTCAKAAAHLHLALQKSGQPSYIAVAYRGQLGHVFVICEDQLLDPTALQFGWRGPVLKRRKPREEQWYWQPLHLFKTVSGLARHQQVEQWPGPQRVPRAWTRLYDHP